MTRSFTDVFTTFPARVSAPVPEARRARSRHARTLAPVSAHGRRAGAARLAMACLVAALGACVGPAHARKARPPRPASSPSTAQILAPSAAATPDALPPDRAVYRCGNSYSAHPCTAAQPPLDVADARTEAQRRQSEDLTMRDKRLAAWYEAGRRERDKVPSAPAGSRAASAPATCTSTTTMTCVPKKPRKRTVSLAGPASAASMGKSGN